MFTVLPLTILSWTAWSPPPTAPPGYVKPAVSQPPPVNVPQPVVKPPILQRSPNALQSGNMTKPVIEPTPAVNQSPGIPKKLTRKKRLTLAAALISVAVVILTLVGIFKSRGDYPVESAYGMDVIMPDSGYARMIAGRVPDWFDEAAAEEHILQLLGVNEIGDSFGIEVLLADGTVVAQEFRIVGIIQTMPERMRLQGERGIIFTMNEIISVDPQGFGYSVAASGGGSNGEAPASPSTAVTTGETITFGGYSWLVLDVQDGRALILSERVLERRGYHMDNTEITWEGSSLRQYLNGEFYNSFSASDRGRIAQVTNVNPDNPWDFTQFGVYNRTPGGANTQDHIFLLSLDELVRYFGDSGQLENQHHANNESAGFHDEYSSARVALDANDAISLWWLRSPGYYSIYAAMVNGLGFVSVSGFSVNNDHGGVRPALWLNLES